jgi:hypothetical protein
MMIVRCYNFIMSLVLPLSLCVGCATSASVKDFTSRPTYENTPTVAVVTVQPQPSSSPATLTPMTNSSEQSKQQLIKREINLPNVSIGSKCEPSPAKQVSPDFGLTSGPGPVYAVFMERGTLDYKDSALVKGNYGQKILWVIDPKYKGSVLIRGQRIDDKGSLYLSTEGDPQDSLYFPSKTESTEWRNWPSTAYIRTSGCYALQVDGVDFSYAIIFEAKNVPTATS